MKKKVYRSLIPPNFNSYIKYLHLLCLIEMFEDAKQITIRE